MITREQIISELKKWDGKPRDFKYKKIQDFITSYKEKDKVANQAEMEKIMSDLGSYNEY
jgi:hypothetical protein